MGRAALGVATRSLYHSSQRGRGSNGTRGKSVAWSESDHMVEKIEIWPGVRRQGGNRWRHDRPAAEQKGHAYDGRNSDYCDSEPYYLALGPMEYARAIDVAVGGRVDRTRVLRRLCQ